MLFLWKGSSVLDPPLLRNPHRLPLLTEVFVLQVGIQGLRDLVPLVPLSFLLVLCLLIVHVAVFSLLGKGMCDNVTFIKHLPSAVYSTKHSISTSLICPTNPQCECYLPPFSCEKTKLREVAQNYSMEKW